MIASKIGGFFIVFIYSIQYNEFMIKIIFFDIDGTLVKIGKDEMTQKVKNTLIQLQNKGIKLFIATGRPSFEVPKFEGITFDGIISFNGSYCISNEKVIHQNVIDKDDVNTVIHNASQLNHYVQISGKDRMLANGYEENLEKYFKLAKQDLYVSNEFNSLVEEDVYQMVAAVQKDEYEQILKDTKNLKIVSWWDKACDIIPKDSGKANAIYKILEYYSYSVEESMAFGDGGNDKDMLMAVGIGIAMKNATDEVKSIADYVCDSVDNDGICEAIDKFITK